MNIAIIGYGVEGKAAYDYWQAGNAITICDHKTDLKLPPNAAAQLGENYLHGLEAFDVIVRSPFVRPDAISSANSPAILSKVTSNSNEFLRVCPTRNIIGITGTKGKGTTSTLVSKMLEAAGKRVHLGGNIGLAALDLLKNNIQPDDYVVLELSSYQLIDLQTSPRLAACLTVMPEHLDWHADMAEYIQAKQQLFIGQTPQDKTIFYADNELTKQIVAVSAAIKIPYMAAPGAHIDNQSVVIDGHTICGVNELKLLGKHNWQNVCAATTLAWQATHDAKALADTLRSFSGLPFRIEYRKTINGIRYFNDSFATGPGSCLAAMRSIEGPKVMILGGYDRGLDINEIAAELIDQGDTIRHVLLIGDSKDRLAEVLVNHGFKNFTLTVAVTMPDIVAEATAYAESGDAVVLSPGFASFGLFKNFEDRGLKFNAAVEAL